MSLVNKILVTVFGLLFVIIIFEVVYYLNASNSKSTVINNPTIKPTTTSQAPVVAKLGGALNTETLNTLVSVKKGVVESSTMNLKLSGVITAFVKPQNPTYKLRFTIAGKNNETDDISFNDDRLSRTKTFELINGLEKPYNINQLKVGDKIEVELTFNLLLDRHNDLIQAKITKI